MMKRFDEFVQWVVVIAAVGGMVLLGVALWVFSVVIALAPFAVAVAVFIWAFRAVGLL